MGIAWSSLNRKGKTTLQMKDKNLPLRENINLDEIELHTNEEWKLPYKNSRYRKYSII